MMTMRAALGAALVLLVPAVGSAFDGTLKLRTVFVERSGLKSLNGGTAPDTEQTLKLTPDQLASAKDSGAQMRESTVYVSGSKVRMDAPLDRTKEAYAIIDTDKNVTWFVIPSEHRYIEWTESDAKAMNEKLADIEKMMKDKMATLPPEQRGQVESMLKSLHGEGEKAAIDIKPTGATQTINGMKTAAYEVKTGDETIIGWVTQEQPDLNKMLHTVQERMEKMTPPSMRGRQTARTRLGEKGFPVRVQTIDPEHYRIEEVVGIDKEAVSPDMFKVPAEYAKQTARDAMNAAGQKVSPPE
jgi:hypothetical protein